MAIIQSILVGKGKGKIGNVVLSGLKGQTVAKQLNSNPSNPRTVAQTDNRVKMANAVLAWQFLSLFFASAKGLRKPLESVYNAFVRIVKSSMREVLDSSRRIAGVWALEQNVFLGNWFTVSISEHDKTRIILSLTNSGIAWLPSYRACAMLVDYVTDKQVVVEVDVTEESFIAGEVTIPFEGVESADVAACYIFDSASSKITNITAVVN